jgi:hypothetical protein
MIDRKYAEKLSASILANVLKPLSNEYHHSCGHFISDFETERRHILGDALTKLWDQLMAGCNAYDPGHPLLVSEKALACLIRRGVDKGHLYMNGTDARVELPHLTYYVDKEGAGCSAGPCVWSAKRLPLRWISLRGEDFADFVFEFDSLVGTVVENVDRFLLEYKVKAMQYEIICQTLNHLGEQFLKPKGIRWTVSPDFTDQYVHVTFSDGIHLSICETIPTQYLMQVFRDIPGRMADQPQLGDTLMRPRRPEMSRKA